jgi:hypothetical protein
MMMMIMMMMMMRVMMMIRPFLKDVSGETLILINNLRVARDIHKKQQFQ